MNIETDISQINIKSWKDLVLHSSVSTWFQTVDAYNFFASLPDLFEPFVVSVIADSTLKGVIVGYISKDKNDLKQFFSRRAIVNGGPLLADDISENELSELLKATKHYLKSKTIYVETRNLNDYSKWRSIFEVCGFEYKPHLNFHVDCSNWEETKDRIGKHRKKYIRLSIRDGANVIYNPSVKQVREFYGILAKLYQSKVKTPLYPIDFFEFLYSSNNGIFILIEYMGRIIGGSVCVSLKNRAVYEWFACGSDGLYKNIHPSSLTKYAGMQYAATNGYPLFDMMGAGNPAEKYGVRDFKAEFGGGLVENGRFLYICNSLMYQLGKLVVSLIKKMR